MTTLGVDAVGEVSALFEAYEAALVARDVEAIVGFFSDGEGSVAMHRFGLADEQHGADQLRQWWLDQPPLPPLRRLESTRIVEIAPGVVVTSTRFGYGSAPADGRQTQVWVRGERGWRIVEAHVSVPAGIAAPAVPPGGDAPSLRSGS